MLKRERATMTKNWSRAIGIGAALGVSGLVLSGCSVFAPSQDTVVYSGWVEDGTIAEGQYYLIDGGNGAMVYPIEVDSSGSGGAEADGVSAEQASWSKEVDGGSAPSIEITPSAGGIAHCVISSPVSGLVLASGDGAPGETAVCKSEVP